MKTGKKTETVEVNNNNNCNEGLDSETILLNLKIISQIKEFQKLNTNSDQLSIDQTWMLFLSRSYYGNSREETITMLENIVNDK